MGWLKEWWNFWVCVAIVAFASWSGYRSDQASKAEHAAKHEAIASGVDATESCTWEIRAVMTQCGWGIKGASALAPDGGPGRLPPGDTAHPPVKVCQIPAGWEPFAHDDIRTLLRRCR